MKAKIVINVDSTKKKGEALLDVYRRFGKKIPTIASFVNDYFAVTGSNTANSTHIKQTIRILQELHEAKLNEKYFKKTVTINL